MSRDSCVHDHETRCRRPGQIIAWITPRRAAAIASAPGLQTRRCEEHLKPMRIQTALAYGFIEFRCVSRCRHQTSPGPSCTWVATIRLALPAQPWS
jgi:hypothetical protein